MEISQLVLAYVDGHSSNLMHFRSFSNPNYVVSTIGNSLCFSIMDLIVYKLRPTTETCLVF